MTPYYSDQWLTVYAGDCRAVLATLPAESVHCVVTSPPYWGLRDYGTASWVGGEGCDHVERNARNDGDFNARTQEQYGKHSPAMAMPAGIQFKVTCGKCGATRIDNQLGLEPTPEQYVENMVAVFREVRRVLRDDGTLWLNLGDSYAGGGAAGSEAAFRGKQGTHKGGMRVGPPNVAPGLKPKDLVGIPWRVAFALQADGWYLRSDIIWAKPNPMPESVRDRPTKAHEYLFLLAKSPRYYFDADAVSEPLATTSLDRLTQPTLDEQQGSDRVPGKTNGNMKAVTRWPGIGPQHGVTRNRGEKYEDMRVNATRNIRSVWTIPTRPYSGAHFAVFPPNLVEPCIKAGTSERGVCAECGAPWRRVVEQREYPKELANASKAHGGVGNNLGGQRHQDWLDANPKQLIGWQPSCHHDPLLGTVPATVLDPFAGSGTVGMVAQSLSRRAVLIDLNPNYIDQQMTRNQAVPLGLA